MTIISTDFVRAGGVPVNPGPTSSIVAVGDLNGGGKSDLIWCDSATGRAVSILGASNGSAFVALAPAITAILAIPILGEWPATSDWIAMLLISGGVYIASGAPLPSRRISHGVAH